jgi:lysophospholipid acyltransferase (LPLAT)-like uncharacterized protein
LSASFSWRPGSWDRFVIPRPFARIRMVYETPFTVGGGAACLANGLERLQASLTRASERAECLA